MNRADRFSAFDPTLGIGAGLANCRAGEIYNAPKRDFGPRVSLAWAPPFTLIPGRQTIFRAGFGIYYDTIPLNNFQEGLAQNPIGPTAGFTIMPTAPIPFGVGVPIFGTGAPEPPFNIESIQHNLKTPNTQVMEFQRSAGAGQKVVFQSVTLEIKSIHQLQLLDINQPPLGAGYAARMRPLSPNGDPVCEQDARPFNAQFPTLSQINTISKQRALRPTIRCRLSCVRTTSTVSPRRSLSPGRTTSIRLPKLKTSSAPADMSRRTRSNIQGQLRQLRIRSAPGVDHRLTSTPFQRRRGTTSLATRLGTGRFRERPRCVTDWRLRSLLFDDQSGVGNFHERFDCVASDSLSAEELHD